jgi:hypothetical protein
MPSTYTPTAAEITPFNIPSDGDSPIQASDVNPAFEALGDAVAAHVPRMDEFLVAGTWKASFTGWVCFEGCGGGGGGGSGGQLAATTSNLATPGGAGGSNAKKTYQWLYVTKDVVYTITPGAGGAGDAVIGASATQGAAGSDSTVESPGPVVELRWPGGDGGGSGNVVAATATGTVTEAWSIGGTGFAKTGMAAALPYRVALVAVAASDDELVSITFYLKQPGSGGEGVADTGSYHGQSSYDGIASLEGFAGGAGGANGTSSSGTRVGGGGGGGGGGGA